MEQNNPYEKAATAYRSAYVNNIDGFGIVVELYKGMMGNIEQAKNAYQAGQLEQMCRLNEKTNKILVVLQSHLDFEQGGDAAIFLNQFYNSIFASLSKVLRTQDPEREFDRIRTSIEPVYQRWCEFSVAQKSNGKN